jgi:RNA polymerase sigma-70 factor (ECF subfamily)
MNQARSRSIDRLRFEQRKKRADPSSEPAHEAASGDDPRDLVELMQRGRAVRAALCTLPIDERRAIESAYFADLTHAQIAERWDEPLGTVKTRIRAGLRKLRLALAAQEGQA